MTRSRFFSASLLCTLLVFASACSSVSPPSESSGGDGSDTSTTTVVNPYEQQRREGAESLLRRWSEAVRTNDQDAIADVIDPAAAPGFLDSELRRAENLAAVPLDQWEYELVDEPEVPVPSAVAGPLDAADVWAPSVILNFAVTGPDADPTRRPVSLLLAKRDDEWRIVSDTAVGTDRPTWRGPWDFGPVNAKSVSTRGGTSVVVGPPEHGVLIDRLVRELPAAVDAVSDFYGSDWSQTALIFSSRSPEEFAASVGDARAATDVAAVTVSDAIEPNRPVSGQRVVFGPAAQDLLTEFTTRSVLRHELTHVAARADTVDGSPTWLLEGFADFSGYRGSGAEFAGLAPTLSRVVAAGGAPTVLPEDSDFTAGGLRATLAYESAWSICAFVVEQFGEQALLGLYAQLATGAKNATEVDEALRAATEMGTPEFLQAWGAWVLQQSR